MAAIVKHFKSASLLLTATLVGFRRLKCGWPAYKEYGNFLYILILFLTFHNVEGVDEANDILVALQEVTTVTHSSKDVSSLEHSVNTGADTVKRLWGVADTVAVVGKLFQYHIPNDAFAGDVQKYELTAAGNSFLPKWLYFNSTTTMLEGVPTESDIGQQYISVKAFGSNEDLAGQELTFAKDVFSIDVMPANHQSSQAIPLKSVSEGTLLQCASGQPITKMTLAIDTQLGSLKPEERIRLLHKISDYLGLNKGMVQLLPRKKENFFDLTALFAGPGNVRHLKTSGAVLQWQVGCEGKIHPVQRMFLNQVEYSSHNGTLADILGVPIIGWHISVHTGINSRRVRRHLPFLYSTPVPALVPTRDSGFPNFDWENNGDNYNPDEFGEAQPDSRIIPSMSSPTYTESTHYEFDVDNPNIFDHRPQHHHHRTKSKGRHHHPTHHFAVSPVYRPHPITRGGNVYGTVVPTPDILFPIRPTAALEEPSRTYGEEITTAIYVPSIDPQGPMQPSIVTSPFSPIQTEPLPTVSTPHYIHPIPEESLPTSARPRPDGPNSKPRLRTRIQKLGIIAGKVFQYVIPENTFTDAEDGSTKHLNLMLYSPNSSALSVSSWVQFDKRNQMIYGLPLEDDIGEWKLPLEASDNHGAMANETVQISVQQHQMERKVNHEIVFTVEYDTNRLRSLADRNIKLVEKLRELFREQGPIAVSNITVHVASQDRFIWSNDTITRAEECREDTLKYVKNLMINQKASVTTHFRRLLHPEFRNVRVEVKWIGYCKERSPVDPSVTISENTEPQVRNQIDNLTATVGVFMKYHIRDDVFYDHEQGTTQYLRLALLNNTNEPLRLDSWIRYDSTINALVGLPLESDEGTHTLKLIAYDRENAAASETFVIIVQKQPDHLKPAIEFSIVLETEYSHFISDLSNKIKVLDKLAHLYGDPDPKYVNVLGISEGSVVFNWTNNTLPVKRCAKYEIDYLVKFLFDANGTVSSNLTNAFLPEFTISKANLNPGLICQKDITPTFVSIIPVTTTTSIVATVETEQATSDDDIFISTVIPAIVIGIMLLLAAIVACILYRKKRKGKMSVEDNDTFVNKGIPVIFADELEERPDPAKAPMIMKEEKPPLPPPEYPRMAAGGSSPSTPPMERKDLSGHHVRSSPHHQSRHPHHGTYAPSSTLEHSENSPLYQPPPPFTTYRDSRMNRPKNTPTYRMPPPYVPP